MLFRSYDPNMLAWLAGISGTIGPLMGGTTNTIGIGTQQQQQSSGNTASSILGGVLGLLGGGMKMFNPASAGAKDGGRIEKADGGGFGNLPSLGFESDWYGFDPRRINEEKMRQWVSRQDVDNATDDQLKDRGWLNPDETYDPYKSDEIDYGKDDGGPVLMKDGGRAEMAFGGLGKLSPYAGPDYLSPGYPGFIQIKDIPHSQP